MQPSGRPLPLHGAAEEVLIDVRTWEQRAMRDGRIDDAEAHEAVGLLRSLTRTTAPLVATVTHIGQCLGGRDGMFGHRVIRGWNEAQRRRSVGNVIAFPVAEDGGEAA